MTIAIVQFPGSNCERETILAVKRAGMVPIEFLWNESPEKLRDMKGYILVGGFSYEDRSRAGIIAALDPVMAEIKAQSELGKPVLGICNGAQILVETGLVPGLKNYQLGLALTENKRIKDGKILGTGFYNNWVHLRSNTTNRNAFNRYITQDSILTIPAAHAEGRFVMPAELLDEIVKEQLHLFQYCDEKGTITDNFPTNPNGSLLNIAAIMNKSGNVLAIMPHPERTEAGDALFRSMKDYIEEALPFTPSHVSYIPKPASMPLYEEEKKHYEFLVQLNITDNQALTVQNTLRQKGIPVHVSRLAHWQIACDSPKLVEQIKQTEVLFNSRKESIVVPQNSVRQHKTKAFLVRPKEDLLGLQKKQLLEDHFALDGIESIHQSILWIFTISTHEDMPFNTLLNTNIIFNPNSHECYEYDYS